MTEGPEWFAPKRLGYGAGLPIAWQGWAVLIAYLAVMTGLAFLAGERPLIAFPFMGFATFLFVLVAARTTRGGWKWRGPPGRG